MVGRRKHRRGYRYRSSAIDFVENVGKRGVPFGVTDEVDGEGHDVAPHKLAQDVAIRCHARQHGEQHRAALHGSQVGRRQCPEGYYYIGLKGFAARCHTRSLAHVVVVGVVYGGGGPRFDSHLISAVGEHPYSLRGERKALFAVSCCGGEAYRQPAPHCGRGCGLWVGGEIFRRVSHGCLLW